MKRPCHALADDRVASSLDYVPFLAAIANKFTLDLKRTWVEAAVRISEVSGRNASILDLALFVQTQVKVANSTFGLKLFGPILSRSEQSKKPKAVCYISNSYKDKRRKQS